MDDVRETYELPKRSPVPYRQFGLMLGIVALALALGFVLPISPVIVVLLALVMLVAVFLGVGGVMRSNALNEQPGRHPVKTPSAD